MLDSTLNPTTVSAAHALKITRPSAWDSIALAQIEAGKADSLLITPADILAGILLNTGAVNAHHILQQLGVQRTNETVEKLIANRSPAAGLKSMVLSGLYGSYRRLVTEAVARAESELLKQTQEMQERIAHVESLAEQSVHNLTQCGMDENEAIEAVRELRQNCLTELSAINNALAKSKDLIKQKTLSITGPTAILTAWVWNAKKGVYPHIKTDDLSNIFSKESQHICCLARESDESASSLGNEHYLLGLAADLEGPGHAALQTISVDPAMLRFLLRESMKANKGASDGTPDHQGI